MSVYRHYLRPFADRLAETLSVLFSSHKQKDSERTLECFHSIIPLLVWTSMEKMWLMLVYDC